MIRIELEERASYITVAAFWKSENPATNGRRMALLTTCGRGIQISPRTIGDGNVVRFDEAIAGARAALAEFVSEMEAEDRRRERIFGICRSIAEIMAEESDNNEKEGEE